MTTYQFSAKSRAQLDSCDVRLQRVFERVLETIDCTIIEGYRSQERQDEAFRTDRSQIKWPNGRHNLTPSLAVDVAVYPIRWKDRERATLFAGFVLGVADSIAREYAKSWRLRWGGDWDSDWQVVDNSFDDLWHFEIVEG